MVGVELEVASWGVGDARCRRRVRVAGFSRTPSTEVWVVVCVGVEIDFGVHKIFKGTSTVR